MATPTLLAVLGATIVAHIGALAGLPEPPAPRPQPIEVVAATEPDVVGGLDLGGPGSTQAGRHDGADDLRANPSCATQCITSGIALSHPDGAELVVTTDVPARIWILVTVGDQTLQALSDLGQTSFSHVFELEPGTYPAMAAAQDEHGHTSHAWGSFVVS